MDKHYRTEETKWRSRGIADYFRARQPTYVTTERPTGLRDAIGSCFLVVFGIGLVVALLKGCVGAIF